MKKIFGSIVLLLSIPFIAISQTNDAYKGIWYYLTSLSTTTPISDQIATIKDELHPRGVLIAFPWYKIQPRNPSYGLAGIGPYHDNDNSYDWTDFDAYLSAIAIDGDLYIGLMIWSGPLSPIGNNIHSNDYCNTTYLDGSQIDWLKTAKGVNRFSTGAGEYYPDYLGIGTAQTVATPFGNRSKYELYWFQMLKDVLHHIATSPTLNSIVRNKFLFIQSCEGTTGDITPYKGDPKTCDMTSPYVITDADWYAKMKDWWTLLYQEINSYPTTTFPNLHLLVNTGVTDKLWGTKPNGNSYDYDYDANREGAPTSTNSLFTYANQVEGAGTAIWRKATNMGHWLQQNFERPFKNAFDGLTSDHLIRDELDFPDANDVNDPSLIFAIAASALHSGLDMWMIKKKQIENPDGSVRTENQKAFDFFNRHVLSYNSTSATTAFCMLRKGLDANLDAYNNVCNLYPFDATSDYRYNISGFGCNNPPGTYRTLCIATTNGRNTRGAAYPGDGCIAQGGPLRQFNNLSPYDVGWQIFPGDYQINLKPVQSDLNDDVLTQALWNQQVVPTPMSPFAELTQARFCRDISNTADHKKLHFDVSNVSIARAHCITVRIYFYSPTGTECPTWSWKISYKHYIDDVGTTTQIVTTPIDASEYNGKRGFWVTKTINIRNPIFDDGVDGADFWIQNNAGCNDGTPRFKFGTIELYEDVCNNP